ncbi:hypothetical protein L1R14_15185, partial [Klebsiella pneumoniae]
MTALIAALPWPEAQAFIIMRVSSRGSGMYRTWKPPGKIHQFSQLTLSLPFRSRPLIVSNGA